MVWDIRWMVWDIRWMVWGMAWRTGVEEGDRCDRCYIWAILLSHIWGFPMVGVLPVAGDRGGLLLLDV